MTQREGKYIYTRVQRRGAVLNTLVPGINKQYQVPGIMLIQYVRTAAELTVSSSSNIIES